MSMDRQGNAIDLRDLRAAGRRVRERRRNLKVDRHRVACWANVDDYLVAIIEDGQADITDVDAVLAVCKALGLAVMKSSMPSSTREAP